MHIPSHGFALLSLLLVAGLSAGCNSYSPIPIHGTVQIKGGGDVARLKGYTVTCEMVAAGPDGQKPSATGELDAAGKFQLSTNATNDGAYPGKYRVALTPPLPFGDTPPAPPVIAAKYKDLNSSDLTLTVDKSNRTPTLEVEPLSP